MSLLSSVKLGIAKFGIEHLIYIVSQGLLVLSLFLHWSSITNVSTIYNSAFQSATGIHAYLLACIGVFTIAMQVAPYIKKKQLVPHKYKSNLRIICAVCAVLLSITAIGSQTTVSWMFATVNVEYGMYVTLLFTLVSLAYSILLRSNLVAALPASQTNTKIAPTPVTVRVPNAPEAEAHHVLRSLPKL